MNMSNRPSICTPFAARFYQSVLSFSPGRGHSMTRALGILICVISVLAPASAHARAPDFLELLGVNNSIDKGIDGLQSVVDRARGAALAIEGQANEHAEARLNQINDVIHSAILDIKSVENKTAADIDQMVAKYMIVFSNLEAQFTQHLEELIDKITCAADVTLTESLKDALGGVGRVLNVSSIEITSPVMYSHEEYCPVIGACRPLTKIFAIREPFSATFTEVRDYLLHERLDKLSRDDTPIASILNSYLLIANLAKRAGCHTGELAAYTEVYIDYINKVQLWQRVTNDEKVVIQ
jgi:hypothetical protein